MDSYEYESEHRKKRRRREVSARPIAARLTFDERIISDVAVISRPLWRSLTVNTSLSGRELQLD